MRLRDLFFPPKRTPEMEAACEAACDRFVVRINHLLAHCEGVVEERDVSWAADRARRELAGVPLKATECRQPIPDA